MKTTLRLFALFSLALFSFASLARADAVSDAKQRIAGRQGEVASLKSSGAIGENNKGYLEVRGGGGSSASVVSSENQDRGVLYAEGAKRTGVTSDSFGRARAKQIAANSAPGVWVQGEDGTWKKK